MDKKVLKDITKICVFIIIANLPFITITQQIGINTFLDSFDNPEYYQYYKANKLKIDDVNRNYIVVQKQSHPDFSITTGDKIFYVKDEGGLLCRTVSRIVRKGPLRRYYTINFSGEINDGPIDKYQIVGKVVKYIDNNAWNTLSLKVWDISINNLNAAALFTHN